MLSSIKSIHLGKTKFKFKYNPETLSFEPVKRSVSAILKRGLRFFFSTSFIVLVVIFFMFKYIKSPKEVMLERELDNMEFNYEVLTDRLMSLEKVLADLQERDDNIYRVILEADPLPSNLREGAHGGAERYANLANYKTSQIVIDATRRLDNIASRMYAQSISFDAVFDLAKQKEEMLASIPGVLPIYDDKTSTRRLVSGFGMRMHPRYKVMKMHTGVDFSVPTGTPIYATGNGVVVEAGGQSGYGNVIIIDHGFNYKTLYAHLSAIDVKVGKKVKRGEMIGRVGNTGVSVGPHLHYEVRHKGSPVNPVNYFTFDLSPEEYHEMLRVSSMASQTLD